MSCRGWRTVAPAATAWAKTASASATSSARTTAVPSGDGGARAPISGDSSARHGAVAVDGRAWTSRLMVVEAAGLGALAGDSETDPLADVAFPDPVVRDRDLASRFVRMHVALESARTRLEREERLAEWLHAIVERASPARASRPALAPRDDRALRLASDYLAEHLARNIGLDELATVAGIGKF